MALGVNKGDRGVVLLLEAVVGLGIFVASILFVFGIFASSQKATVSSKNLAVATDLAKEVMETEIARGYDDIIDSAPVNIPIDGEVDGVKTTTTFVSEVQADQIGPGKTKGVDDFVYKRVVVTISWPEVTGAQRKIALETIVVP